MVDWFVSRASGFDDFAVFGGGGVDASVVTWPHIISFNIHIPLQLSSVGRLCPYYNQQEVELVSKVCL